MIEKPESRKGRTLSRTRAMGVVGTRERGVFKRRPGLKIPRHFSSPDVAPFDQVEWELRTAAITGENGQGLLRAEGRRGARGPGRRRRPTWSSQKYFRGVLGTPERERSVRQLIARVVDTITRWGEEDGYFASTRTARGLPRRAQAPARPPEDGASTRRSGSTSASRQQPQCSACFINSVEDTMESILTLAKTEGMLFKWGSGTGTNFSPLRSSQGDAERRRHRLRARSAS